MSDPVELCTISKQNAMALRNHLQQQPWAFANPIIKFLEENMTGLVPVAERNGQAMPAVPKE